MATDKPRRGRGQGSLIERTDAAGRVTYYGKWSIGDRQVKRRLGLKRAPGSRDGLTKAQAEARLRDEMGKGGAVEQVDRRVTLEEAGRRYVAHVIAKGRKPATVQDYDIILTRHLVPFFGAKALGKITVDDVERYLRAKAPGLAPKTLINHLALLSAIFEYGRHSRRRWAAANPVTEVEERPVVAYDTDLHFLTPEEVEAVMRAVPDDAEGPRDRALYATAAWAGLRQGELAGLRWRDIDFAAGKIRVRRSFTRGREGTPKSRTSIRAVPMWDRLAAELDQLSRATPYGAEDDPVFCHPHTGGVLDASRSRKRYKAALAAAGVREVRFHDLRHTFGTQMAAAGCPMPTLQAYMGHANIATTMIYVGFAPDDSQGAMWAGRAFGSDVQYPVSTTAAQGGQLQNEERPA